MQKRTARTGNIDALEGLSFRAEDAAAVKPEVRLVQKPLLALLGREAEGAAVEPDEIRSLWCKQLELGQIFCQIAAEKMYISFDVILDLRQPVLTIAVSCFAGHKAERIQLAVACGSNLMLKGAAQLGVRNEDIRNLQSGDIEGFAGRSADDAVLRIFCA